MIPGMAMMIPSLMGAMKGGEKGGGGAMSGGIKGLLGKGMQALTGFKAEQKKRQEEYGADVLDTGNVNIAKQLGQQNKLVTAMSGLKTFS